MSKLRKKKDAPLAPTAKVGLVSSTVKPLEANDFLSSGWRVAVALLAPAFLGIWLDGKFRDDKLFTMVGVVFGIVVANLVAYQYVSNRFGGNR